MIVEFEMWTPFHYFMIYFPFVLTAILYYLFRSKSDQVKNNVGIALSVIMIGILIMRNVYIWVDEGALNPEVIPFQVCHFASFVFLLTALSKNKVWGTIAWCLNLPAGFVSVVFANGLVEYPTLLNIQAIAYIAGHMLIVTTGLYMFLVGSISINWKSMKKAYLWGTAGFALSVLINNWFNRLFDHTGVPSNYFYSLTPESGTPLEAMFDLGKSYTILNITFNPVYLLMLGIVGAVLVMAMYGVYHLINLVRKDWTFRTFNKLST